MKCNHAENLFDAYLRKMLSHEEKRAFQEHLAHCEACQSRWETYRLFLSDTAIEEDFPVPNQLNAKIKYTLQQARNKKKVPFYRNKQVLSYATACCFLLVAGIFGTSHFQQIKKEVTSSPSTIDVCKTMPEPSAIPAPISAETDTQEEPKINTLPRLSTAVQTPAPDTNQKETILTADITDPMQTAVTESKDEPIPATEADLATLEPMTYGRNGREFPIPEYPADYTISEELRSVILENYAHTKLAENVFSVQIPEEKLEELLQITIDTEEQKTEFILEFTAE